MRDDDDDMIQSFQFHGGTMTCNCPPGNSYRILDEGLTSKADFIVSMAVVTLPNGQLSGSQLVQTLPYRGQQCPVATSDGLSFVQAEQN